MESGQGQIRFEDENPTAIGQFALRKATAELLEYACITKVEPATESVVPIAAARCLMSHCFEIRRFIGYVSTGIWMGYNTLFRAMVKISRLLQFPVRGGG